MSDYETMRNEIKRLHAVCREYQSDIEKAKKHFNDLNDCIERHQYECDTMRNSDKGALIAYIGGLKFARNIIKMGVK